MEQFVKMLYDRLESNKDLQMQLFIIMQNAINEMHNNGIIAGLTGEAAQLVHDPDPEVRVREKTSIAKAVGKQFIPNTVPVPSQEGFSYLANVHYDPRFVNSITLCFQGGELKDCTWPSQIIRRQSWINILFKLLLAEKI